MIRALPAHSPWVPLLAVTQSLCVRCCSPPAQRELPRHQRPRHAAERAHRQGALPTLAPTLTSGRPAPSAKRPCTGILSSLSSHAAPSSAAACMRRRRAPSPNACVRGHAALLPQGRRVRARRPARRQQHHHQEPQPRPAHPAPHAAAGAQCVGRSSAWHLGAAGAQLARVHLSTGRATALVKQEGSAVRQVRPTSHPPRCRRCGVAPSLWQRG